VVELGERALPPPAAVAWPQIVYGDFVPQHTQIYAYYRVRGSHVLLLSVSVGCVCVCVLYGVVVHTPGIAVCAAALLRLPPFIGRRLCTACAQFNYAVFVRGRDLIYLVCVCVCVCVSHTHTHTHTHATTNSLQHPHMHAYEQSRMHSKGNMYMCMNTAAQYICT
jgi:hypothetical protein